MPKRFARRCDALEGWGRAGRRFAQRKSGSSSGKPVLFTPEGVLYLRFIYLAFCPVSPALAGSFFGALG